MLRRTVGQWRSLILVICFATAGYAQNPIQTENLKVGTTDWQLTNPALNHEIEGYASLTSVNRGGQISLYVNSSDSTYTIDIFRAGWYGLAGGRRAMSTITRSRTAQPACPQDSSTGMTECRWTNPYVLTVPGASNDPTNWASGVYLAKLTGQSSGKQSYIIFVVRDDARPSKFLLALDVTTYQAYNSWGGKSLYDYNSSSGRASKVSYNRPYAGSPQSGAGYGIGAGEFLTNYAPSEETWPAAWEYNAVRWLEKEGYDVTYATVVDLHEQSNLLSTHSAYLSFGHNEYWSMAMFNNVAEARDNGVNLGFFGANVAFWQIRFESSPVTGQANRTQVCYKSTNDPVTGPTQTVHFRDVGLPESALVGVWYVSDPVDGDIVVQNTSNWVFQDTGLQDGDHLTGLLGYEVDEFDPESSPPGTIVLGNSPYGGGENSNMSVYTAAASSATVFATGSMQWVWGLDDYNSTTLRPSFLSQAAQQITKNLLAKFAPTVVPPLNSIRVNSGGAAYTDSQSVVWSADTGFTGGSTDSVTTTITNTTDQTLYKSERYGAFSYNFTAPAGAYSVTLKFAEIYFTAAGKRIFSVAINGATVLSNFDIVAQAGAANKALDKTFAVNSTGTITIQFITGSADLPKVSAIQITPVVGVQISPTSASLRGNQTQQFTATVTGSSNTAVTWSMNPSVGTLSSAGLYTAPSTITTQQVVTVTATSAADATKSASAAVTLIPSDFSISASPSSRTVVQGSGASYTATITPSNGFSTGVTFSVSGLPTGAGGTFNPTSVPGTGTSTLSVTTAATTPAGSYTVTITGTSGTLVHATTVTLIVNSAPPPGSFTPIRVNSGGAAYTDSQGLIWSADTGFTGGSTASVTTTITNTTDQTLYKSERYGAFSYNFTAPAGAYSVTLKFAEIYFTAAGKRIFNVAINGATVLSSFDIVAQAGGANKALDKTFAVNSTGTITIQFITGSADLPKVSAVQIVSASGVSVQVSPVSATLSGSQTQQFTATVTGSSNTAVTWSMNPSVGTLSSAGLYTAPSTVTTQQVVTVTATSVADPTRSASAAVTLIRPDFSISASPSSRTVVQGSGTSYTATITPSNGFSAGVTFSVSGLPTGAGGTFNPTSVPGTGTSTLSVTTAATTPAGSYTVTITGTSGTLVHATTVILIVNSPGGSFTPIRVNSGGTAYTDSQGLIWSADTGFTGGNPDSTTATITNTSDQKLYQTERWGTFSYSFTAPAGAYAVTLKFAEIYFTAVGQRIFSVAINGTTVLSNFDIFAQAGGINKALDKTFAVNSTGTITIQFIAGSADLPKVSAVQIQ